MLVLRLEMWPKGDETRAREIGRTYIYNDGGTLTRGDYEVRVCRRNRYEVEPGTVSEGSKFARFGSVRGYPRLRFNVWRLVLRCLSASFPEER